jgi:hypothetical protein
MKIMKHLFFLLLATLFFFSHASAQTMNVKQDGNAVQVTIQKGFELISSSQVYISETPFGTASKLSPVDHQKYVAGIKMLHTSLPKTFLNTGTEFVVYDLPLNKKLYVNAAVTSGGLVYWVNTNGGEAVTTADAAIYSIELNNPVISGETIKVSGVIDTVVHSRDFQNYSFGFSIEDGLGNITPIPPVSGLKADGKGVFATTIGISKLDNVKKYTIVLKIINPFGGEDTSLRQQFSKEKGFIPSLATEEGRESFDAQTYKLLAPLPGLSIIRDTGLCLEYKASIEAEGGKTDDIVCDINDFLNFIMKMAIAISAVVLVIRIVISGFNYMVTDIPFLKISSKNDIATALGGLALALGAWVLLNTINPRLVSGGVELQGVEFAVEQFSEIDNATYQKLTGQNIKPKKEYLLMVEKETKAQGLDACIAKATITIESAWRPNVIGCDENVRSESVPSRRAFIQSGIKSDGTKFSERSVEVKVFNSCPTRINPSTPGYGLDWRFSKGGGLMQMTVFPDGYKSSAWFSGVKEGGSYWQARFTPHKDFNTLIVPENNIRRGVSLLKENLSSCGGNIEKAYRKYQSGNCNGSGTFINKTVKEKMVEYNVCKSGAAQYSSS